MRHPPRSLAETALPMLIASEGTKEVHFERTDSALQGKPPVSIEDEGDMLRQRALLDLFQQSPGVQGVEG